MKTFNFNDEDAKILGEKSLACGLSQAEFVRVLIRNSVVEKIPGYILSAIKPLSINPMKHSSKLLREKQRRDPNHFLYDPTLALEDGTYKPEETLQ